MSNHKGESSNQKMYLVHSEVLPVITSHNQCEPNCGVTVRFTATTIQSHTGSCSHITTANHIHYCHRTVLSVKVNGV